MLRHTTITGLVIALLACASFAADPPPTQAQAEAKRNDENNDRVRRVRVALALANAGNTTPAVASCRCRGDYEKVRTEAIAARFPVVVFVDTACDSRGCELAEDGVCIPVALKSYAGDKFAMPAASRIVVLSPGDPSKPGEKDPALYVRKTLPARATAEEIKAAVDEARKATDPKGSSVMPAEMDWFSSGEPVPSSRLSIVPRTVQIAAKGWHIHECPLCGSLWSHNDSAKGKASEHRCPNPDCRGESWEPKVLNAKLVTLPTGEAAPIDEEAKPVDCSGILMMPHDPNATPEQKAMEDAINGVGRLLQSIEKQDRLQAEKKSQNAPDEDDEEIAFYPPQTYSYCPNGNCPLQSASRGATIIRQAPTTTFKEYRPAPATTTRTTTTTVTKSAPVVVSAPVITYSLSSWSTADVVYAAVHPFRGIFGRIHDNRAQRIEGRQTARAARRG